MKTLGVLDRYVVRRWSITFLLSALGIPAVGTLIHFADTVGKAISAGAPIQDILLGSLYIFPGQMAMLMPAGVLFATVFTLNSMGRHSELTAVKAGGISFRRLILPILVLSSIAVPFTYLVQEIAAPATTRQRELFRQVVSADLQARNDFAYQGEDDWTMTVRELQRGRGVMSSLMVESPFDSTGARWIISADSAHWNDTTAAWALTKGASHFVDDSGSVTSISYARLQSSHLREAPRELMTRFKQPEEQRAGELAEYLERLRRSGTRAPMMAVDLELKYAVPFACLVVALFGAPLAVTNPRAGAALGLAMALGTTLFYLTGTQIMKSVGGKEVLSPIAAAWCMNVIFLLLGLLLLKRVRT
jgi:lipopolysaccharide export system permease protein